MTTTRRKILVSTGAGLLLKPFIDCIEARAAGPVLSPCFFTMWKGQCQYGGSGNRDADARNWVPTMDNGALKLPVLIDAFEKVKAYMTFVVGLDIATAPGDWHHDIQTLFTGTNNSSNGQPGHHSDSKYESLDYYVARRMGTGKEPLVLNPYQPLMHGTSASYASWGKDATGKIFRKVPFGDPLKMFMSVFGGAAPGVPMNAGREAAIAKAKKSMLDGIVEDAQRVKASVAAEHRPQIESTLEGIRKLETTLIGKTDKPSDALMLQCMGNEKNIAAAGKETFDSEANLTRTFNLLIDIALSALRCGLRTTVSFQFLDLLCQSFIPTKMRASWKHPKYGVTPYHFEHCHLNNGKQWIECEQYIYSFYARFLEGLMAIPTGDGNLLKQSLGIFATTMSHNHSASAASYFIAGNAGGRMKSNRILTFGNPYSGARSGKNHSDLLVSVLQAFGYDDVKSYGDPSLCHGGLTGFLT